MRVGKEYVALTMIAAVSLGPLSAGGDSAIEQAVKKELKLFQGHWKAVAIRNADGSQAPENEVQMTRLVIEGNKVKLSGKLMRSGTFTVNPAAAPTSMDVILRSDQGQE